MVALTRSGRHHVLFNDAAVKRLVAEQRANYHRAMSLSSIERPDLPECMTWAELQRFPEEIAEQIELWNGRVVWVPRGPGEHQTFAGRLTTAIELCVRNQRRGSSERTWRANFKTDVFLGRSGKSDFVTPAFLVHRSLESAYQDLRAADVLLVGEVSSPSMYVDMEAKKGRYASAKIPWYWEVALARESSAIATVRAYGLETQHGPLPDGVRPLRSADYILVGEWSHADPDGVQIDFPFPIQIPWSDLEY